MIPLHNPVSALVYSALRNEPETVIVDGQAVMHNRRMEIVSKSDVMTISQQPVDSVAERAGTEQLIPAPWPKDEPRYRGFEKMHLQHMMIAPGYQFQTCSQLANACTMRDNVNDAIRYVSPDVIS